MMLFVIFQYGWEPVPIQGTLIGFEAILESSRLVYLYASMIMGNKYILIVGIENTVEKILV